MPKAKKLPSGSWRCQVSFTENGTRVRKSVTVKDPSRAGKKECERLAAELAIVHSDRGENITVHEAVANYITVKERVLSPSTIRAYNLYLKRMDSIWSAKAHGLHLVRNAPRNHTIHGTTVDKQIIR